MRTVTLERGCAAAAAPPPAPVTRQAWVVIIGVGRYENPRIPTLKYAVADAEAIYLDLLAAGTPEPTWETWLVSWCQNRLGAIALQRGRVDEARSRFLDAARRAVGEPERAFAITELRRLLEHPDAAP